MNKEKVVTIHTEIQPLIVSLIERQALALEEIAKTLNKIRWG
jgi:hypothetical protein